MSDLAKPIGEGRTGGLPVTDHSGDPLLGVSASLTGRRWRVREADDRVAQAVTQRLGVPDVIGRAMVARGIGVDAAAAYLSPTLRASLPDPSVLADMDRAVDRIAAAIKGRQIVGVFGDYDVDGASSAALLLRVLHGLGVSTRLHVPDRLTEGYGPNAPALQRLKADGAALAICVDCGATAVEPLAAAATAGLDVIVLDHHTVDTALPPCVALVNPNRLDDDSGLGHLAACGVVFLTLVALLRRLRTDGWFVDRPAPDLMALLDLVALGTVCDVVPLTGLNRALVAQGLKVMRGFARPGLAALARIARIDGVPGAYHAGFVLGPRINAAGRVGQADLGARLLVTDDPLEAERLAAQLDVHNDDRRALERQTLDSAVAAVERAGELGPILLVGDADWHPGVIGIVAGRLKDRYHRPACVIAWDGDVGKASGRSIPGVDLGALVMDAKARGLLVAGGGHRMAAGFTVARASVDALQAFLAEAVRRVVGAEVPPPADLTLDGTLSVGGATVALAETVERMAPFGPGNPEPRFAIANARVVRADRVGGDHVRCLVTGTGEGGRLPVIAFRCADEPLGQALLSGIGRSFHLAGAVKVNRWNGRTDAQFKLDDATPADA